MSGRVLFIRPTVDSDDLGLHYRDATNRTGRCPGCAVEVGLSVDDVGRFDLTYRHDHDCPVLASTARPDYRAPSRVELRRIARNEPCPCASGRKYKACHGRSS